MKHIKYFIFTFLFLFIGSIVKADQIYKISMDIYLTSDGNANITEIWDVKASGGSEWYKQVLNLGNEKLSNFKVSMDGKELTYKEWNVNESMSEKAGYYGINYISDGLELCFGKTDENRHSFTLTYDLSNVIFNTQDSQVFYQTLLQNVTLDNFEVVVRADEDFADTLDVWGYGYKGYAYVQNGQIKMSNEENSNLNNEYVVLEVKFPLNTFNTTNSYSEYQNFDDVHKSASDGTFEYDYSNNSNNSNRNQTIFNVIFRIFSILIPISIISIGIGTAVSTSDFGKKKVKIKKEDRNFKDINYFRDIPCNKDIFKGYWISGQYKLIRNKTDFLGAVLLKWLKNGNVENVSVTSKILKKEQRAIKLVKSSELNDNEKQLFDMMQRASKDGVLERNEFKRWCSNNYEKILGWFNDVIDDETIKYESEGLLTSENKSFSTYYYPVQALNDEAVKVAGLKKFLKDFSNIKERESIEVKLWEEYLMFAQIFGIAEKVAKEFKDLYPDVITEEYYSNMIFIHDFSSVAVSAATTARSAAESYSSGGGGFSSGGGGIGSFGGGGSMGGR